MDKRNILDASFEELTQYLVSVNEKPFRAMQIFQNLHDGKTVDEISNISKALKESLKENFITAQVEVIKELVSKDGTVKFLYKLFDNNIIEGVLMQYKYGNTLCVSTQVGCRMNCSFCASTIDGLVRNLTAGEILGQIITVNRYLNGNIKDRKITNVVLMGSGEPLDNYDNVTKFFTLLSDERGINIARRNISLSTCGIVPNIIRLADEGYGVTLTISLHNTIDDKRTSFMPINKAYNIQQLINSAKYYFDKTGRRVIFEYSIIKGENDRIENADRLAVLLRGFPCHVNLIVLNTIKEKSFASTNKKDAYTFSKLLTDRKVSNSVRRQMGADINGACGQLRRFYLGAE